MEQARIIMFEYLSHLINSNYDCHEDCLDLTDHTLAQRYDETFRGFNKWTVEELT